MTSINHNWLKKGSVNTIVLKLLTENKRMYGYEITKKVMEMTNGQVTITEGALYPALHKMEADGLLEVTMENIGNRNRKYYSLTRKRTKESKIKLPELRKSIVQLQKILQLQFK